METTSGTGNVMSEKSTAAFERAELARLGITVVTVDQYHYKAFRYTNMRDAIAEAERDASAERGKAAPRGGANGGVTR
jgi:hypothetical protein